MISVEQILLLQQKVEGAVQKIGQLKAENDALRTKCSELTKALSDKTELLSSFSADEKKIEDGILSALSRLDSVENALLDQAAAQHTAQTTESAPAPIQSEMTQEQTASTNQTSAQTVTGEQKSVQPLSETAQTQDSPSLTAEKTSDEGLFADTSFETEDGDEGMSENEPPADIF